MSIRNRHYPALPPFMDGQLPSSHVHNILQFARKTSIDLAFKHLLGHKKGIDGMQPGMTDFFEHVGHHYYDDVATLISRHTEYYFYCCGLPLDKHQAQFDRLAGKLNGPTRLVRLPTLCAVSESAYLRCPDCEEEQLNDDECGFTYDHRRMGSPFLLVCPIHATKLRSASGQMLLFDKQCQVTMTAAQVRYAQELGSRAAYCMEVPPQESGYHKDAVIESLKAAGRIAENGRMRLSETISDFQAFTAGRFSDVRLDHLVQTPYYVESALRSLLRPDRAVHPMWCILFRGFAEECPREAPAKNTQEKRPRRPTVTPSQQELEIHIKRHGSLTAAAEALDMNLSRVIALCNRYGIRYTKKTKRIDGAIDAAIQREYDLGTDPAEVAKRCGVSLSTAYSRLRSRTDGLSPGQRKINARTERAKFEWLRLRAMFPQKHTTALRHMAPAIWKELRTKDNAWLEANRPEHTRRTNYRRRLPPAEFISALTKALTIANKHCASTEDMPINKSAYRIRMTLGVSEYVSRTSRISHLFKDLTEERLHFVKRRLAWARKHYGDADTKLWFLARTAGLRESTIVKFQESQTSNKNPPPSRK